jgi:PKD repeat protein
MGIEVIINNLPTLLATLLIIVGLFFILVSKAKITGKINFIVTERNSKTVFDVGIVVFAIGLIIGLSSIPLFNVDKSSGSFLVNNQPTEGNNQPTKLQAAFVANRTSGNASLLVMFTDQHRNSFILFMGFW